MKNSHRAFVSQRLALALALASSAACATETLVPLTLRVPVEIRSLPVDTPVTVECVVTGPGGQLGKTSLPVRLQSQGPAGILKGYSGFIPVRFYVPKLQSGTTYSCALKVTTTRLAEEVLRRGNWQMDPSRSVLETRGSVR